MWGGKENNMAKLILGDGRKVDVPVTDLEHVVSVIKKHRKFVEHTLTQRRKLYGKV